MPHGKYPSHYEKYVDHNKECPFCGGNRQDVYTYEHTFVTLPTIINYEITCYDCGCNLSGFDTEEDALDAWNRRDNSEEKGNK